MSGDIDFKGINRAALGRAPSLLQELIPGGKIRKAEYVVRNPGRNDKKVGSFTINHKTGQWADFADNDSAARGGDVISWFAYALKLDQSEAARQIAEKLGIPLYRSDVASAKATAISGPRATRKLPNDVFLWGEEGPPRQHVEIRRHYYPSAGFPRKKVKIKFKGEPKARWVSYFRVLKNGAAVGWQAKKPDDYTDIPFVSTSIDPFDAELKADEILWPEGEKDVETLSRLNLPAFTFGGIGDGLPDGLRNYLTHRRLVILADNHDEGREHAEKKARVAHEAGAGSIRIVDFPELPPKQDISYFIEKGGTVEELRVRIDSARLWSPATVTEEIQSGGRASVREDWRTRVVTASDLQAMNFPPVRHILTGYIPEGVTILASKPKFGKSWLMLDVCLAATADRFTLGTLKPAQGDVLCLALEDSNRRLKRRLNKLSPAPEAQWPRRLSLVTEWKRADEGGLDDIEDWCRNAANPLMIVIDTLEKFRPVQNGKTAAYTADYAAVSALQKVATKFGIAIVIVHHLRKMDADDPFDTVSGTLGLTGAADTILVLTRKAGAVTLHARGRDIEGAETALRFDRATCRWTILGAASEVHVSSQRAAVLNALSGAGSDGLKVSEIVLATGSNRGAVDTMLFKMRQAGEVVRIKTATYALPQESGKIGEKERCAAQAPETPAINGSLPDLPHLSSPPTASPKDTNDLSIPDFLRRH
jgi:hypothetical protein